MTTTSSNNLTTLYNNNASISRPQQPYGNANVVSLLAAGTDGGNTITNIVATGTVTSSAVNTETVFGQGLAVQGYDFVQMQYSNSTALPVSPYSLGTGSWFYLDAGGGVLKATLQVMSIQWSWAMMAQ